MSNVLERYAEFRKTIASMFSAVTQQMVDAALQYADKHLEGQVRYDGTPMLDHAVGVAYIVATEVGLGRNSTVSAIIHDVIRLAAKGDDEQYLEQLLDECKELFGEEVVGIVSGLANTSKLIERIEAGEHYDLVEVMACPGGCICGGGQPYVRPSLLPNEDPDILDTYRDKRAAALYSEDERQVIRQSHNNAQIKKLYEDYLGKPNSHKAHELLHNHHE